MESYWAVLNGRGSSRTAGYPIRVTYDREREFVVEPTFIAPEERPAD